LERPEADEAEKLSGWQGDVITAFPVVKRLCASGGPERWRDGEPLLDADRPVFDD
jgi:hypothetical protein